MRLTAEARRAVCFHEAGHAVMHALCGSFVYRVAVAPAGVSEWHTESRKGAALHDLWGVCEPSGTAAAYCLWFDEESGECGVNRDLWRQMREEFRRQLPRGAAAEQLRQVRAHVCGLLAGPAAEALHLGEEPVVDYEGDFGVWDDWKAAQCYAWMLPRRGELERLHAWVVAVLKTPSVWQAVGDVANALERAGELEGEALDPRLPPPVKAWPPTARSEQAVGAAL